MMFSFFFFFPINGILLEMKFYGIDVRTEFDFIIKFENIIFLNSWNRNKFEFLFNNFDTIYSG